MRKLVSYIFIFILTAGIFFPAVNYVEATSTPVVVPAGSFGALAGQPIAQALAQQEQQKDSCGWVCWGVLAAINEVLYWVLQLSSLFLWLCALLMDAILNISIIQFKEKIEAMTGIQVAWILVRDLMNLAFVFLLLYQGIRMILGRSNNAKNVIFGIVLASILINFSLFMTKVMIDASNIVTIGFYNAIVEGSETAQIDIPMAETDPTREVKKDLAGAYMNALAVNTFWDKQSITDLGSGDIFKLVVINLFGIVLFLMVGVIFFAVAIMFLVRYAILIVLLMFSPLAVMGIALPQIKNYQKQWWETLMGQVIFAPLFFIMTWVVLTLISSEGFNPLADENNPQNQGASWTKLILLGDVNSLDIVINFIIIIVLTIISLSVAKKYATQGSASISSWTNKVTSFAGGTLLGAGAWAGRQSLGRVGNAIASNVNVQKGAKEGKVFSRLALYSGRQARDATFDVRNAKIPTNAIGDAISGTVGRTKIGKAIGLDDVNIPSIPIKSPLGVDLGKATTKGYKQTSEEKTKRIRDREATDANELAIAEAKRDILAGANSTNQPQIDSMQKALSNLSEKQTEALVASNRELLKSQNFANAISVKQLEAINKSDQFSEEEKTIIKNTRFADINNAVANGTVPSVKEKIKGLSDSELEMLDPEYLKDEQFVSALKSNQIEQILNKSGKFTSSQKKWLTETRDKPIKDALASNNLTRIRDIMKRVDAKTRIRYMNVQGRGGVNIALDPAVLSTYTPQMLTKMATDMNQGDIQTLRTALENHLRPAPGATPDKTYTWLMDPDKGMNIFS